MLKNVIALAAGMCDGLGFGDNTKSTLLTRGRVEISRLGMAASAERLTFAGLSDSGGLITTSFSRHSRNRASGEKIGQAMSLRQVLESTEKVAEDVWTTTSSRELAQKLSVAVPTTDEVNKVLFEEKDPRHAVVDLMTRGKKRKRRSHRGDQQSLSVPLAQVAAANMGRLMDYGAKTRL